MSDQQLVCPFLDESISFAAGVEFGMLFARMKTARVIDDLFTLENQDQILLLASRASWDVVRMKRVGKDWFRLCIRKALAKGTTERSR